LVRPGGGALTSLAYPLRQKRGREDFVAALEFLTGRNPV
jgi:hypothetical protein